MNDKWELAVPLPADWVPSITRCSMKTCRNYIAVLSRFTIGCLMFESPKEYAEALDQLYTKLEELALRKIEELGLPKPDKMRWRGGTCWCPVADECLQLVAVYYVPTFQEAEEIRQRFEKYYRTR